MFEILEHTTREGLEALIATALLDPEVTPLGGVSVYVTKEEEYDSGEGTAWVDKIHYAQAIGSVPLAPGGGSYALPLFIPASGGILPATTCYIGHNPLTASFTVEGLRRIYIRKPGAITMAEIRVLNSSVSSDEAISAYVRKNGADDFLIETVGIASDTRQFHNEALNIPMVNGDWFEVKVVLPAMVTSPGTWYLTGYVIIDI